MLKCTAGEESDGSKIMGWEGCVARRSNGTRDSSSQVRVRAGQCLYTNPIIAIRQVVGPKNGTTGVSKSGCDPAACAAPPKISGFGTEAGSSGFVYLTPPCQPTRAQWAVL